MWKCSLSTYTGGDGEVESSRALCKKEDAKHEDRRRREWTVVFCIEEAFNMAKFWKTKRHEDTTEKRQLLKDDIDFLVNLQREMNTQDHLCQADPRYWVIRDYRRIYGDELNNPDGVCLYDENACEVIYEGEMHCLRRDEEQKSMIIQSLKDAGKWTEELKDAMDDAYSIEDLEDALYELDISMSYYEEYPVDSGIFFTHEAAVQHLKSNDYHYGAKAHTYAETAWRSARRACPRSQ